MSIRFDSVSKSFETKKVLNQISFEIRKGEIVFIIGQSGTGKSVTLKHMMGMLSPDEGEVFVGPFHVNRLTSQELLNFRRKCGLVFQFPALFDFLSVYENIAFGIRDEYQQSHIDQKVRQRLKSVRLSEEILDQKPSSLSFGMQKRVSIARTLAPEPDFLLYDEPTTGLDPMNTRAINHLIRDIAKDTHVTSVVVSHDMGCALEIADRILVLDQGRVLAFESVETIRQSRIPIIREFLQEVV